MFVCEFIYTDKKQNRTSVLNWYLLKRVLVPTAVSTTRRALSPCNVEGSLDKPVNLDNQRLSQPH